MHRIGPYPSARPASTGYRRRAPEQHRFAGSGEELPTPQENGSADAHRSECSHHHQGELGNRRCWPVRVRPSPRRLRRRARSSGRHRHSLQRTGVRQRQVGCARIAPDDEPPQRLHERRERAAQLARRTAEDRRDERHSRDENHSDLTHESKPRREGERSRNSVKLRVGPLAGTRSGPQLRGTGRSRRARWNGRPRDRRRCGG